MIDPVVAGLLPGNDDLVGCCSTGTAHDRDTTVDLFGHQSNQFTSFLGRKKIVLAGDAGEHYAVSTRIDGEFHDSPLGLAIDAIVVGEQGGNEGENAL